MLAIAGKYNKFSDELKAKLAQKLKEAGDKVYYKFSISNRNPALDSDAPGASTQPPLIYPSVYELSPIQFEINDNGNRVYVGLPKAFNEKGEPTEFKRIEIFEKDMGLFQLDLTKFDDQDIFFYLELHPKMEGGIKAGANVAKVRRIDKKQESKNNYTARQKRKDAMAVADHMSIGELKDFACAMGWDEYEDIDILKDRILEYAENNTDKFEIDLGENISYKSTIKRALDRNIIKYIAAEAKFVWESNNQLIAALERTDGTTKGQIDGFSDWLSTNKNGEEVYKRMKNYLAPKATV